MKKHNKNMKLQKENQLRAKKLHREMQNYWRKKDKDLMEIKKKREKLEAE